VVNSERWTTVVECSGCGGLLPRAFARFCGHCGRPVDAPPSSTPDASSGKLSSAMAAVVQSLPALEPAPIPLTRRKQRAEALIAVGAMLGNELPVDAEPSASSISARPGNELAADASPSSSSAASSEFELAHATTWRAETIEALPPPARMQPGKGHAAAPAVVPPRPAIVEPGAEAAAEAASESFPRFPGRVDVGLDSVHNFYAGFGCDIRAGGLFVATCAPFEVGESLLITFTVAGFAGAWSSRALVEWAISVDLERKGCLPGMGLRLLDLGSQIEVAINRYMQQREPIFFEPR
jgi:Tfp pilus assembly protein PilZ